jgi:hypothetical protein
MPTYYLPTDEQLERLAGALEVFRTLELPVDRGPPGEMPEGCEKLDIEEFVCTRFLSLVDALKEARSAPSESWYDRPPITYVLEQLDRFVNHIARDWGAGWKKLLELAETRRSTYLERRCQEAAGNVPWLGTCMPTLNGEDALALGKLSDVLASELGQPVDLSECKTQPPSARDPKLEERDKYIYDEHCKGTPLKIIMAAVKKHWKLLGIESVQGIRFASSRYAKRHGKLLPPLRIRRRAK